MMLEAEFKGPEATCIDMAGMHSLTHSASVLLLLYVRESQKNKARRSY